VMEKDFYIDESWLAAYFEKDWFDHVLKASDHKVIETIYPQFDPNILYCDYHEKLVSFLKQNTTKLNLQPKNLLEVGSSLGRTFFEICLQFEGLKSATLIEPSKNLASTFKKIFEEGVAQNYLILKGNFGLDQISFNSSHIKHTCSKVETQLLNRPFQEVTNIFNSFDLVICSNVIDQCESPLDLVNLLKESTLPGGLLLLLYIPMEERVSRE
jgi:SAM-dependent methyltransferase